MKSFNIYLITISLCLSTSFSGVVLAEPQGNSHVSKVGEKLGVGIANVATGFVEIPKTMIASSKRNGVAYGATAGLVTGMMQMMGRTLAGTLDLMTFMIPTKSLVHSEYIWNNFNKETTYTTNFEMRR